MHVEPVSLPPSLPTGQLILRADCVPSSVLSSLEKGMSDYVSTPHWSISISSAELPIGSINVHSALCARSPDPCQGEASRRLLLQGVFLNQGRQRPGLSSQEPGSLPGLSSANLRQPILGLFLLLPLNASVIPVPLLTQNVQISPFLNSTSSLSRPSQILQKEGSGSFL